MKEMIKDNKNVNARKGSNLGSNLNLGRSDSNLATGKFDSSNFPTC
tara:strand:- start:370 stop:507 length:138 start_codon:yes stop_codon:yes gene_type:complete